MKSALKTRPKPAPVPGKAGPQIPIDDRRGRGALYLSEIMPPAMRRELGRLLVTSA
jgi:hypothetical protein